MAGKTFLLATRNIHKAAEIRQILYHGDWELLSLDAFPDASEVEEIGATFLENALLKARAAFQETGVIAIADDSGLEVDSLQGAPGVRSSRFAGESGDYRKNNEKLLRLMEGVPTERRTGRFRCVVALVDGEEEHSEEGVCEGIILDVLRGGGGFGYDPVFWLPHLNRTFAEISPEEKNRISHRGIAFRRIARWMEAHYGLNYQSTDEHIRGVAQPG